MMEDWNHLKLGDVIKLQYGKPLPKERRSKDGKYPAFGANGIKCYTNDVYRKKSSIIIGRKGSAGEVNLTDGGFWPLDVAYYVEYDNEKYTLKFLYYLLSHLNLPRLAKGVKPGINRNDVYAIEHGFPPLPEQKRIVAILDEAFAAIATATANAERNLVNARAVFVSRLHQVFSMRIADTRQLSISELATHSLGKMLDKKKNRGVYQPYLRNVNVRWFGFDLSNVNEMKFEESEYEKYTAKSGDLLICEGGHPGRAAIWSSPDPVYFQKAIHRVRFHNKAHTKWFLYHLYYWNETGEIRKYFTGAGIQHLTGKSLAKMKVPILPQSKIEQHIANFEKIQAEVDRISYFYQQKLDLLAELKQAILHKAFTGELTADPQAADRLLAVGGVKTN